MCEEQFLITNRNQDDCTFLDSGLSEKINDESETSH